MKNFKLNRKDVAFAFIDMQDKLLKSISNRDTIIENAKILSQMAKILKSDSLFTVHAPDKLGYTNEEIKEPLSGKIEFSKLKFNSYEDEDINSEIKRLKKRQFVLCGIETHICVLQTVRSLLSSGYEVFVIEDAVGSRNEKYSQNAINQMREMGAVITNVETVLFDLAEFSGTKEFTTLQKLII